MGRAKRATHASDERFAAVLGARRGPAIMDPSAAIDALKSGQYAPALELIDTGSDPNGQLAKMLARRLARDIARRVDLNVTAWLHRAGALRAGHGGADGATLPVFDTELFQQESGELVHDVLLQGAHGRRGSQSLMSDCEAAVISLSHVRAAEYLRRGGAAHLQNLFGRTVWRNIRDRAALMTDIHPSSGALSPLLVSAVDCRFVAALCADEDAGAVLSANADRQYRASR